MTTALAVECHRHAKTRNYTAVSFTIWLRFLRWMPLGFLTTPVIFGTLATWKMVGPEAPVSGAIFTLAATLNALAYSKGMRGLGSTLPDANR